MVVAEYLSSDRWIICRPSGEGLLLSDEGVAHPGSQPYDKFKLLKNSPYVEAPPQEEISIIHYFVVKINPKRGF